MTYAHTIQVNITNMYGDKFKRIVHTPSQLSDLLDEITTSNAYYEVPNKRNYAWVDKIVADNKQFRRQLFNPNAVWPFSTKSL